MMIKTLEQLNMISLALVFMSPLLKMTTDVHAATTTTSQNHRIFPSQYLRRAGDGAATGTASSSTTYHSSSETSPATTSTSSATSTSTSKSTSKRKSRDLASSTSAAATTAATATTTTTTTATNNNDDEEKDEAEYRIVGGTSAVYGQFPFFVKPMGVIGMCGASLVAPDVVLSAAHCEPVFDYETEVLVGAHDGNDESAGDGQIRTILSKLHVHPQFDISDMKHDLMLFKIQSVTKDHLIPISLNTDNNYPSNGQQLQVIGMGIMDEYDWYGSDRLQYTTVNTVPSSQCRETYAELGFDVDADTMLCAAADGKDSCQGDSGGPIFDMSTPIPTQVGVVSWGIGCAREGIPGVYSRTSGDIDWLKETICDLTDSPNKVSICSGGGGGGTGASSSSTATAQTSQAQQENNACVKTLGKCSKGTDTCCGGSNTVCGKVRASDTVTRCRVCRKRNQLCGSGKAPCCNGLRCTRRKEGKRFVNRCLP